MTLTQVTSIEAHYETLQSVLCNAVILPKTCNFFSLVLFVFLSGFPSDLIGLITLIKFKDIGNYSEKGIINIGV